MQHVFGQLLTRIELAYFVSYNNWEARGSRQQKGGASPDDTTVWSPNHWFPNDGNGIALCKISSATCCTATLGIHFVRAGNSILLTLLPAFCSLLHSSPLTCEFQMGYSTSAQSSSEHSFFLSHRKLQLIHPKMFPILLLLTHTYLVCDALLGLFHAVLILYLHFCIALPLWFTKSCKT